MIVAIHRWLQSHRYRVIIRQLRSLSGPELSTLGIAPSQIEHLAFEASRADAWRSHDALPPYWTTLRIAIVIFVIVAPIAAALRVWLGYAP